MLGLHLPWLVPGQVWQSECHAGTYRNHVSSPCFHIIVLPEDILLSIPVPSRRTRSFAAPGPIHLLAGRVGSNNLFLTGCRGGSSPMKVSVSNTSGSNASRPLLNQSLKDSPRPSLQVPQHLAILCGRGGGKLLAR